MRMNTSVKKWIAGFGALGSAAFMFQKDSNISTIETDPEMSPPSPWLKWNHNWDRRDPRSLINPKKINILDRNAYNNELKNETPHATRHIIMIRHGQYNKSAQVESEGILTKLGEQQAETTGKKLQQLNFPYTVLVHSTMIRAQQTAEIIKKSLKNVEVMYDPLLNEGSPIKPEPLTRWKPEKEFYVHGARIEAAFRKYFHRACPKQKEDSYTILVAHANVIRYFVCRALQFPPEGWLRLNLNHASITWISIYPNGMVKLWTFSDTGHMNPNTIS